MGRSTLKSKTFLAVLLVLAILLLAGCKKKMNFQEYLDLGNKYLLELNYEEAAVAFSKAIELEPRELGAYEKLAEVYGAQGNVSQALETLNQAISVYEGLSKEEQTEERKAAYERIRAASDRLSAQITLETDYMEPLKKLKTLMLGDTEAFGSGEFGRTALLGEKFEALAELLTEPLLWQQEDGTWLAIYPGGYIYAGNMENGQRSGEGAWYFESFDYGMSAVLFKGTWEADYPNGAGAQKSFYSYDGGTIETRQGDYRDGLENGTMTISMTGAGEADVYQYTVSMGVPDQAEEDPDSGETIAVMEHLSGPDRNRWHYEEDSLWGINGAMKK